MLHNRKLFRAEKSALGEIATDPLISPKLVYRDCSRSASVGSAAWFPVSQVRGVWSTHLIGRTHFHGTRPRYQKSESSASKIFRDSGMTVAFKTTFEVFTRVGPDNSLERLTERSVGLVTDQSSDFWELFVTPFK